MASCKKTAFLWIENGIFSVHIRVQSDLLEAYVHVKGHRLSWVADRGDAELSIGGGNARDQLDCIGARVVSHLQRWEQS